MVLTGVDERGGGACPTTPSVWDQTVPAVWRIWSLHLLRTEACYLIGHLVEAAPSEGMWAAMQPLPQPAAQGFVSMTDEGTELYGTLCSLPMRLRHLCSCPPVALVHVQQLGDPRLHCMPSAVDGTSRHEGWYVHYTIGGTSSRSHFSSCWLLGGSEEWATMYAAAQEVDFCQQLWDASEVVFQECPESTGKPCSFCVCWQGTNFNGHFQEFLKRRLLEPRCVTLLGAIA